MKGWAISSRPGSWSKIEEHMKLIIADGDENTNTCSSGAPRWCRSRSRPRSRSCCAAAREQARGSSIRPPVLLQVGSKQAHPRPEALGRGVELSLGQLLFALRRRGLLAGQKDAEGALKGLITERDIPIEPKGVDLFMVPNSLHMIIAGNEEWIVPASHDERRYAAQDVSSEKVGDNEYFAALVTRLDTVVLRRCDDLLAMDLKGWHPPTTFPRPLPDRQKAITQHGMDAFIEQVCHDWLPAVRLRQRL